MSKDSALVVIDAQLGVEREAYKCDEVLENINLLMDRVLSNGTPVIYMQHNEQRQDGTVGPSLALRIT